jgi:hypothetical protein
MQDFAWRLSEVAAEGVAPDDGFTGYAGTPSNVQLGGRWVTTLRHWPMANTTSSSQLSTSPGIG